MASTVAPSEPALAGAAYIRLVDLDLALHTVRGDVLSSRDQGHGIVVERHDRRPTQFRSRYGEDTRARAHVDEVAPARPRAFREAGSRTRPLLKQQ